MISYDICTMYNITFALGLIVHRIYIGLDTACKYSIFIAFYFSVSFNISILFYFYSYYLCSSTAAVYYSHGRYDMI